jgi:hypothetical protein
LLSLLASCSSSRCTSSKNGSSPRPLPQWPSCPSQAGLHYSRRWQGVWVARRGPRGPMIVAGLCIATGVALLIPLAASTPYPQLSGRSSPRRCWPGSDQPAATKPV